MQVEKIEFVDSTTFDFWMPVEDVSSLQCSKCKAVGTVVHEDETSVRLALFYRSSADNDLPNAVSTVLVLPKGAIVSREVVEDAPALQT